jgi:hypothetical protein
MDHMSAFARGEAARGNRSRVFDWVSAAKLIRDRKPRRASAGLAGDWEYTGGTIYTADGIPNEDNTYVYLCSTWATPQLDVDGDVMDCWIYKDESPGWDAKTYWPPEAREELNGGHTKWVVR